jgi:cation/acetate symporter
MVLLHLATFLAGDTFKWIISWMVLITILAVMSGLVLAASASLSRDLLPKLHFIKEAHTIHTKISIVLLLVLAATLAALFEQFNLAFLFGLAFAWSASAHFPVLFLHFFYPAYTEKGAFYTLLTGAISSLLLIIASPTVWVKILGFQSALFPYHNPTLFSLPLALICGILFSLKKTHKTEKEKISY